MPIVFTDEEISQIVGGLLDQADKFNPRKVYDPGDDCGQLMNLAYQLPGACEKPPQTNGDPLEKLTLNDYLDGAADTLFAINPLISRESWRALAFAVMHKRYAGTMVRFRKRPSLAAWVDATEGRMSFNELKAKHPHLSRRRLYQIIEKANKVK